MQNFVWALNALDRRQVDMRQGGRVKGGSTWELDSVLSSMYLPTTICCLSLVRQCREIATQSVHTVNHVAKIGLSGQKLVTFCLVPNILPTCCRHLQPSGMNKSDSDDITEE